MILRQLNGEASPEEKRTFSLWLLKKPENLDFYIEIKNLWELPLNRQLKFPESRAEKRINQAVHKKERKLWLWQNLQKIAAVAILALMIGAVMFHYLRKTSSPMEETTAVRQITKASGPGEQLRVTLPDGSIVRLNAGSSLGFPEKFDLKSRNVHLTGEAFFEVTKDPEHPFMVRCGQFTTTVLGTAFNVKGFQQENVTVTVARGKVKVAGDQVREVLLMPNEQATYDKRQKQLQKMEVDARNYYDWTEGTIRFNNDSLQEVVKILERWYNVRIDLNGFKKKNIRINGSYKDKKLDSILDGLSFMYGLRYDYEDNQTICISMKNKDAYEIKP